MSVRAARPVALTSFAPGNDRSGPDNQISSPMELTKVPHPECDPDPHVSLSWCPGLCLLVLTWCLQCVPRKNKKETVMIGQTKNRTHPSPQIGAGWLACCSSLPPTTPAAPRQLLVPTATQHQQLGTPRGRPTHPCLSPCRCGRSGLSRCQVRTRATRLVLIDTARRLSG